MPISRFVFFSVKHRFARSPALLPRFDPSRRIQSCGYAQSAKNGYKKPTGHPVVNVETQASRSWGAYVIPPMLLGFGGLVAFLHYNDERRAIKRGTEYNTGSSDTAAAPIIGGPFTLVNTENRVVNEQEFLGNWVLLYFGYTSSPDSGPDQVQIMAKAIDTLESKENLKVLPVFVTIDPQRDGPAQLRAYLKEFDPRIVGLTGPVSAVRQMAQEYRVYFKKVEEEGDDYLVESSHNMYLIDPKMKVVRCFGVEYNSEQLLKEISKEMNKHQVNAE
ncbi:Protein SCO1-like protein 2 [Hibiscus syriacus]|uniref:Protein SCO1-like protein 2 n=1 Tax=Hibiscus syriacus TaxID=106335 RepID=A0A6A3AYL0_HIBSY|nr:protein SCO1 homolog 2, mitochondrial [Hibiscus syriacus]KAE8709611.1 Protein SCO1-like protein 2 [Hibiscus syriacus]